MRWGGRASPGLRVLRWVLGAKGKTVLTWGFAGTTGRARVLAGRGAAVGALARRRADRAAARDVLCPARTARGHRLTRPRPSDEMLHGPSACDTGPATRPTRAGRSGACCGSGDRRHDPSSAGTRGPTVDDVALTVAGRPRSTRSSPATATRSNNASPASSNSARLPHGSTNSPTAIELESSWSPWSSGSANQLGLLRARRRRPGGRPDRRTGRRHAGTPSGGCSSTRGLYSTSWMRPSKVRCSVISRATSG